MSKYNNLNEIKKTRLAYDNITVQLSKKNTRFQYKLIKKGGRASEFENVIEWLCLSGIVSRSEEHTSELQSRFDLVCRLLLGKKHILSVEMQAKSAYKDVRSKA